MGYYSQGTQLLAEQIVNTRDTTRPEPEFLRTPADLANYLQLWNMSPVDAPTAQDLAEVLELRSRLRAVFAAEEMAAAVAVLNDLLQDVRVRPELGLKPDGSMKLELAVEKDMPLARRLAAEAALGLSAALEQYGIERLHICGAVPCTEVFIDTSRNHSRRYCCEQCANRHNVAAHRQRQKTA